MGIEMIIGLATALLAIIAGAFGLAMRAGPTRQKPKPISSDRRERRCYRRRGRTPG
jgi:hypothetical protein